MRIRAATKKTAVPWWSRRRESGRWRRLPGPVLSAARLLTDALQHGLRSPITTWHLVLIAQQRGTDEGVVVGGS
jgi:hypothetical protein